MSVILHISDTHFGTEQPAVVEALLQLREEQAPDLIVVSGDITQRARRAQFRAAQLTFAQLRAPLLVVPGNHDIPLFNLALRFLAPYLNYARAFGRELQPEFIDRDLFVLGVNTTRAYRHIDGEVSGEQIRHICNRLRQAEAHQLKIVVTHQPVHVISLNDEINLLHGYREAVRHWVRAGADLILGGHIHLPYVRPLPEPARRAWAVQAGTALSHRVRGGVPNSVNLIHYDNGADKARCRVEQWNFTAAANRFALALTTDVALSH